MNLDDLTLELPGDDLVLNLGLLVDPNHAPDATIQERFDGFHAANPWVLDAFVALTRDWLAKGGTRTGIKMLAEIVRWQYSRATKGDQFRLNNDYTSRYVRLLLAEHPEFKDVFHLRELRAA